MKQACLALLAGAVLLAPISALGEDAAPMNNAGVWRQSESEEFRAGFVSGIVMYLMDVQQVPNGAAEAYRACLGGQSAGSIIKIVDAYLDRNAVANTYRPDVAVLGALYDMCKSYLPQAGTPK